MIECITYRITGHSRRDARNYQPKAEQEEADKNEPLKRFPQYLLSNTIATQDELDAIRAEIDAEIEVAVESAMAAPDPRPEDALEGLYV